ncbi:MAG: bifunctional UDP-N-acetylglucosamine diphosphorylase/glucosamine-1-phosphate N-acetyltransferase GlmU [Myxococcota bacterium]
MKLASIVLCAGKGTRMKSQLPKVLHHAAGRPLGAWSLLTAREVGADPIIAVVGHEAEEVEQGLTAVVGAPLRFALQAEQKGTGHAVQCGLTGIEEPVDKVLILYGDTPLLKASSLLSLLAAHTESGAPLAMLTTVLADPTGYGRILRDERGGVCAIIEHKDASPSQRAINEVNPGIYLVEMAFLQREIGGLSGANAQGELYLTDLVSRAAEQGGVVSVAVDAEETLGVNDRVQLAEAEAVLQRRLRQHWMRQGVSMRHPDSTFLDATVTLGSDVELAPQVSLRGQTRIANNVEIGVGCVLTDTVVESGARLHAYTICEGAQLGPNTDVGPFARLRPGADLRAEAKVGNFVEVKKSVLGRGSKANHLAYLGDAEIGEGCNVGAGTITCNYDGHGKHRTVLGDRVFIGSNSTLVAPITIGTDAYVGAASCVSRDVPADSLAIGRAKQENKEGYAARIRSRNERRAKK